jgi:hypothetical protein
MEVERAIGVSLGESPEVVGKCIGMFTKSIFMEGLKKKPDFCEKIDS